MIIIRNLWKKFRNQQVLKGLDLEIKSGETLVILGRSGVGKSVLLKHIIGILKPDAGEVIVDDLPISKLSGQELYQVSGNIGMLFQGGALFDSLSIKENTAFYLRQHLQSGRNRISEEEISRRVKEALHMVGLENTEQMMPSDLSGGMRKRAALARLIVYRPRILLYDEPTTGLDPITAMQINELIIKTQHELKGTSVVVTHDLRSALEVGDRLAMSYNGQIVAVAPKHEFMQNPHPEIRRFIENASGISAYMKGTPHHERS